MARLYAMIGSKLRSRTSVIGSSPSAFGLRAFGLVEGSISKPLVLKSGGSKTMLPKNLAAISHSPKLDPKIEAERVALDLGKMQVPRTS